nr:MAG TPA: minor tail protein [Bacteriophage sp.]
MSDTTIRTKIVIEGEKQYKAALADINRQLKETKSALSVAAAEYANADSATRTTAQQTEALNLSLEQQRQRLALMEEQLGKVEDAYGKNSRQAVELRTKINNARVEMAKTETQMRGFTDGLDAITDASGQTGEGLDGAAKSLENIGDSANQAQGDVQDLAASIGDVVGQKLIEFEVGKKALEGLRDGIKWALGEAIQGETEDAQALALAGSPEVAERRRKIKDEVDRRWAGQRSGDQTVSDVAAVDTALGNAGIMDDEYITRITNEVITLDQVFGQSTQDTINRATSMVNAYGITWDHALDLMTKGMQDFSDGGAQMLNAYEDYSQVYQQLGYDADNMYSALKSASNDQTLGKDSNLNKGVENFVKTLTSGSNDSKTALKELKLESSDIPAKMREGGDAASEAVQRVLTGLQSIEDKAKRDELGKTLFGDKIWTETNGQIVDTILAGYQKVGDVAGATEDAMTAKLDTFSDTVAGTQERISQSISEAATPAVEFGKKVFASFNEGFDADGIGEGVKRAAGAVVDETVDAVTSKAEEIKDVGSQVVGAFAEGFTSQKSQEQIDSAKQELRQLYEDALNVGDLISAGQYLQDYEALYGSFYDAGEESASGMSEGVESKSADVSDAAAGLADDATQAVSDKQEDMQTAAEEMTQAGVDAITDMEPDMQDAGETLGMAAVDGTDSGMGDLSQVGDDSVDGLLSAINAREDDAYSAGKRIGGAFRRGYTTEMKIHSPSRVMAEAGEYTVEGLLDAFDEADDRVSRAGSALAEAFSGGYNAQRASYSPAGDAQGGGMGISANDIAEAVRGALDGVGLYFDGQRTGRVVAEGVSQQIATRSSATVSGQSASRKGW